MKFYWLNKQNNKKLIVFFCGWSFDYKPFEKLSANNFDILVAYDYSDIAEKNILEDKIPANYTSKTLITWSMGVYTAYLYKDVFTKFENKIAVNGTPFPVDDNFGIPIKTFDLTLKYIDTGLQGKFQKNLFKRPQDYEKYLNNPVLRSIENQKAELIALNNFIKNNSIEYTNFYNSAIISDTDKIIPTRNQTNFWKEYNTPYNIIDSGHFPFFDFNSWEDIINAAKY